MDILCFFGKQMRRKFPKLIHDFVWSGTASIKLGISRGILGCQNPFSVTKILDIMAHKRLLCWFTIWNALFGPWGDCWEIMGFWNIWEDTISIINNFLIFSTPLWNNLWWLWINKKRIGERILLQDCMIIIYTSIAM